VHGELLARAFQPAGLDLEPQHELHGVPEHVRLREGAKAQAAAADQGLHPPLRRRLAAADGLGERFVRHPPVLAERVDDGQLQLVEPFRRAVPEPVLERQLGRVAQLGGGLLAEHAGVPVVVGDEGADDRVRLALGHPVAARHVGHHQTADGGVGGHDELGHAVRAARHDRDEPRLGPGRDRGGDVVGGARTAPEPAEHGDAQTAAQHVDDADDAQQPAVAEHGGAADHGGLARADQAGDEAPGGSPVQLERRDDRAVQLVDLDAILHGIHSYCWIPAKARQK
jgi:hypothetical protein